MIEELKDAISILKLDKTKMSAVAGRRSATKWGIIMLAAPPVVNLFLSSFMFPSGFGAIFSRFLFWPMIVPVASLVVAIFAMSIIGEKVFRGGADHIGFFRVLSYASVFLWLSVLPFLFDAIDIFEVSGLYNLIWSVGVIWILVVAYHMLISHQKLSQRDAAISLFGGIVAYFIAQYILGRILVGRYYKFFY